MRFKKNGLKVKPSNKSIKKFMDAIGDTHREGKSLMTRVLEVMHADNMAHAKDAQRPDLVPYVVDKIIEFKEAEQKTQETTVQMPLNGKDIKEWFDLKPSPIIGKILAKAQEIFNENPDLDKSGLLLELAKVDDLIPVKA